MILPEVRDPRLVTIRRGGSLTDADHRELALWTAMCAEHVLHLFEDEQPHDPRPRDAIAQVRGWARGEVRMMASRASGGHAMGAARRERDWQRAQLGDAVRELVLGDQRRRDTICWSVFED